MAKELDVGCTRPESDIPEEPQGEQKQPVKETKKEVNMIKVGQKMPDFTAPAYHKGKFIQVKLSDYLGKWIVLCFYPGDFTFV